MISSWGATAGLAQDQAQKQAQQKQAQEQDELDALFDEIDASAEEDALADAEDEDWDELAKEDEAEDRFGPEVEELVVTGRKSEGLSVESTMSATAFDEETLANFGVQDVSDIAKITPNLQINTISATSPTFFVRGVGLNDFASNATGAVAIYQDGIPINAPALQLGQLFDSASVQVQRGPQTWGNERNASAGVIDIRSKLPDGEFDTSLKVSLGKYRERDFEAALAFPLMKSQELSTRISFRYSGRDPFVDNRCGGLEVPTQGACGSNSFGSSAEVPAGLPNEVNGKNRWALRGQFRYQPDDQDMDWLLNLHGSKISQETQLGQVIGTAHNRVQTKAQYIDPAIQKIYDVYYQDFRDQGLSAVQARKAAAPLTLRDVTNDIGLTEPFAGAYDLVGNESMGTYGGSVTGDMGFGDVQFTTKTGAEAYDRNRETDYDFSPDQTLNISASDRAWQLTQSFEAASQIESASIDWTTGGFFLYESMDSYSDFLFNTAVNPRIPAPDVSQQYSQRNYSFGLYGNGDWDFGDVFTLAGGVRVNYDRKDFVLSVSRGIDVGNTSAGESSATWVAPTGGISLTYRPTEVTSIYVKYSHGWKPGVFNSAILANLDSSGGTTLSPDIRETDPESVDSFELGVTGSWLEGALEMRAAAFYYKYHDYQVFLFKNRFGTPPQFEVVNANDAQIYGLEADLYSQPLLGRVPEYWEALNLDMRFSWLESEFLDFTDSRTIVIPPTTVTQVVDYTGNRLPNTPRFKVSGGVWWQFDLFGFGTITPRYDVSFQADVFFDPSEGVGRPISGDLLPQYALGQRAYTLHDIRLTYRNPDGWFELSGWVHNASDVRYKTYTAYADSIQSILNWVGDPRTFGVSMKIDIPW